MRNVTVSLWETIAPTVDDVTDVAPTEGGIISAFDELRALGRFGRACLTLVQNLMREEAHRFPALTPEGGWQGVDLEDLASDFLTDRLTRVTANLLALATDDASMGRLLRVSIRRWLIDRARETAVGSVRRTIEKLLSSEDDFEEVPAGEVGAGRWRLTDTSGQPWAGDIEELIVAARVVSNVKIPKWSSSTRRAPLADRASMVAVARAALEAAGGGSLELAQLVTVFVARFPAALDPAMVPLPEGDEADMADDDAVNAEQQLIQAEEELSAAVSAASVVGMLSPPERQIVPFLDDVSAIQEILGCGRSQAYHKAKRLRDKLSQLVGDSDDVRGIGLEVIRLCRRTTPPQ